MGGLVYAGFEMYQFADGVIEDAQKRQQIFNHQRFQNGDIIFQTSTSDQSKAIQLATHSKYSHMGIVFEMENQFYVYEAVQPVKFTPLNAWMDRGLDGHYVVKRLKNSDELLDHESIDEMKKVGLTFKGKPYDIYFEWSDERIYCSELVWKIYQQALNVEIGKLEALSDFDLTDPMVKQKMEERIGNKIPMNEMVVSPASMFDSPMLTTVATDTSMNIFIVK